MTRIFSVVLVGIFMAGLFMTPELPRAKLAIVTGFQGFALEGGVMS